MSAHLYTMSWAAALQHQPEHPERTTRRCIDWDVTFKVWPSVAAMDLAIRMQGRRPPWRGDWCRLPLRHTEQAAS